NLTEGETLTLETLLYGVLLCSGNDAAVAVAQHVGGSVKGFVALMNEKARELGMEHSSFANPNGLDDEQHYSTARDMAKLARAALENETLMRIASTRSVTIGGRTMTNHNKLLHYVDGCLGLKTGYTKAAGRTLVSCAEKNGQRLIAVTLQDGNDWADHQALYEYGFSAYPARTCAVRGQALTQASVSGGVSPTVPLIAGAGFCYPAAETERLTTRICLDEPLRAPVSAGKTVGAAVFCLNGTEIGRVPLVAGRTVMPKVSSALAGLKLELKDE
ncbi:MAG: D-alanyl-D-alanine carboxypeptidase family protein, partial [Dysosmobacter sp.]